MAETRRVGPNAYYEWDGKRFIAYVTGKADEKLRQRSARTASQSRALAPRGKTEYIYRGDLGHPKTWKHRFPGMLKKSIKMYKSKYKHGGYTVVARENIAFYARFVELGTPGRSRYSKPGKYWKQASYLNAQGKRIGKKKRRFRSEGKPIPGRFFMGRAIKNAQRQLPKDMAGLI